MKTCYEYKPKAFEEIVSQKYIIDYFQRLIKNPTNFPNAYLFYGEKGIGKSTLANVFSNQYPGAITKFYNINTFENIDTFKDVARNINNMYKFSKDIYILVFDEFHRASKQAQQVLLDTLEDEKIKNVFYIFTTTEIELILTTIISRTIQFYFKKLTDEEINQSIDKIITEKSLNISQEDKKLIVYKSEGHLRDAYHFLDLYVLAPDLFRNLIPNTYDILKDFFSGKDNINEIRSYSVNILIKDLDKYIENYTYENLNNVMKVIKVLEIYSKFKNEVNTIDHLVAVLRVLRKVLE